MSDRSELIKLIDSAWGTPAETADVILESEWFRRVTSVTSAAGRQLAAVKTSSFDAVPPCGHHGVRRGLSQKPLPPVSSWD